MKITAKNLCEKWDEIKGKLPKSLTETAKAKLEFADIYDDLDEESAIEYDTWLEKVNAALEKTNKPAPETPKPQPKTDNDGKKDKPKPEKTEKKDKPEKKKRPKKVQVGESPKWLKTLDAFVKSFAGKTKDTWRVRNYITDIQAYFSKNHGKQTPNIDLIREIQDKLIKYANSDDRKVTIPAYDDLVSKCKKAIRDKDITVSNKAKKPEIKPKELSGFTIGFSKKKK